MATKFVCKDFLDSSTH